MAGKKKISTVEEFDKEDFTLINSSKYSNGNPEK